MEILHAAPGNWPTIVLKNGDYEQANRKQDMLEDYLLKDLNDIKNQQLLQYYDRVTEG